MTNKQPTSDGLEKELKEVLPPQIMGVVGLDGFRVDKDVNESKRQRLAAYIEQHYVAREEKTTLCAYGHSETRLVHHVNEFDGSYCYTELLEGESDLHTLQVAQVYDADFDAWKPLEANQ